MILIRDTAGAPKTALTYSSSGIDVCYTRVETDNDVVLTAGAPAETTLTGAHVDWGFVKVDDTNAPGLYKLDIADGVFASGAWSAVVSLICTGCDPVHIEFMLTPQAPYDGVNVATISANAITATAINADAITEAKIADNAIAAEHLNANASAEIATAVWQDATAGDFTVASSIGKALYVSNVAPGGSGGHMISGTNAGTTTLANLSITGQLDAGNVLVDTTAVITGATTLTGVVTATNGSNDIKGVFVATNGLPAASIASGAITNAKFAAGAIDAAAIAAGAIDAATFAADVDAEAAAWIWNAAAASYGGAGTYGQAVEDILTDTATTLQGELDGIQADTEDIQARLPGGACHRADELECGGSKRCRS